MPPVIAGGLKAFLVFGVLALLLAPVMLVFLVAEREKGVLTYVFAFVMSAWAILALMTARGIKYRKSWSQSSGVSLAIMLLCPLLAFVVAPPGLLGGILMVMAGMLVVPSIGILATFGKPDWKQWYGGLPADRKVSVCVPAAAVPDPAETHKKRQVVCLIGGAILVIVLAVFGVAAWLSYRAKKKTEAIEIVEAKNPKVKREVEQAAIREEQIQTRANEAVEVETKRNSELQVTKAKEVELALVRSVLGSVLPLPTNVSKNKRPFDGPSLYIRFTQFSTGLVVRESWSFEKSMRSQFRGGQFGADAGDYLVQSDFDAAKLILLAREEQWPTGNHYSFPGVAGGSGIPSYQTRIEAVVLSWPDHEVRARTVVEGDPPKSVSVDGESLQNMRSPIWSEGFNGTKEAQEKMFKWFYALIGLDLEGRNTESILR